MLSVFFNIFFINDSKTWILISLLFQKTVATYYEICGGLFNCLKCVVLSSIVSVHSNLRNLQILVYQSTIIYR